MKKLLAVLTVSVVAAASLGIATSAWASTIYSYTGYNFNQFANFYGDPVPGEYTSAMRVAGWFEVADPIAGNASNVNITPLSWSFSDGRNTYSNVDSALTIPFQVSTNVTGEFSNWNIAVQRFGAGYLSTVNIISSVYDQGAVEPNWYNQQTVRENAVVYNNPGVWTSTTPVPEPSTMLLLGSGLTGLVGYGRRRFKK